MEQVPTNRIFRAFFAVPPQVHLLDISGPAHVFYEAKALGASIEAYFISMHRTGDEKSSAGVSLGNLVDFSSFQLTGDDWVIVPGLDAQTLFSAKLDAQIQLFLDWLRDQHTRGAKICSVCTGAYIVARSGIMDGRECTTHWKYIRDFKRKFPCVRLLDDRLFVKDGNLYSSAGVTSGIDLSLYLLEEVFGPLFAINVAKEIVVYLRRAKDDPQLSVFLQFRNHIENRVHQIQDYMAQHLEKGLRLENLAAEVSMSPRNLSRLFKKTTGITLGDYQDKLRLEKAVQLLATGQKVEVVSLSCGLKSANQLRTLLKKYKGVLPQDMLS